MDSVQISNLNSDAFGRLRVAQPATIFDSKQLIDNQPLFWNDVELVGGGSDTTSTYSSNRASSILGVSANKTCTRVRQTKRRFNYQPGRSQNFMITTVLGTIKSGITKRIGLFDDKNGIFLITQNGQIGMGIRSYVTGAAVDTVVWQTNWNIDKLDNTGPSGETLNITKAQIFFVDFEWLGVGSVRYGFVIDGKIHYIHQAQHANIISSVYMSTPNLPLRYEISNDGTGAADTLECICSTVISEGGYDLNGFELCVDSGVTGLTTGNNTSIYPLLSLKLQDNKFASTISLSALSIICNSTADFRWSLTTNPSVTGTALSYSNVTNSALAYAVGTSATTIANGTLIRSGYMRQTSQSGGEEFIQLPNAVSLGTTIAGVSDILVLGVQRLNGTTETFYGSLSYREVI